MILRLTSLFFTLGFVLSDVPQYPSHFEQKEGPMRHNRILHSAWSAKQYEFPFFVLVQVSVGVNQNNFCGGAIISGQYIVTGAHCLMTNQQTVNFNQITIVGGKISFLDYTNGLMPDVIDFKIHPEYVHSEEANVAKDVALIQYGWSKTTPSRTFWSPIELPSDYEYTSECYVLGAGLTKKEQAGILKYNTILSHLKLNDWVFQLPGYTCAIDSGSPVTCTHTVDGKRIYKLHGSVIGGDRGDDKPPCSKSIDERKTTVTNFQFFDAWIRSIVFPAAKI